jgi:hypothetical protein
VSGHGLRETRGKLSVGLCVLLGALASSSPGLAEGIPLELSADELSISSDRSVVEATGSVTAELEEIRLSADALTLERVTGGAWRFEAAGDVLVVVEGEVTVAGDRAAAILETSGGVARLRSLKVETFSGESTFTNSVGEEHTLYFRGTSGEISFDEEGEASLIEVFEAEITTCDCCGLPFRSQPYTLRGQRLQLYPDRLLVVFGLTARLGGVSALWLPVYAQPLEETLESPLFPAFGRSALRGWFLKWNVPFFLSETLYGAVLLDYYSKHDEIGIGLTTRYAFADHSGQVHIYSFPAKVGDAIFEFRASHRLPQAGIWTGGGRVDYREEGESSELDYRAEALGSSHGWTVSVSAEREIVEEETDDEDASNDVTKTTDRIPEVSMSREPWAVGPLSIQPRFDVGLYREQVQTEPAVGATRLAGGLTLTADAWRWEGLSLTPRLGLRANAYLGDEFAESRTSLDFATDATWGDVTATYALRLVRGDSPFEFDAEAATHRIDLAIRRRGRATLEMSAGLDLHTGEPDPLRLELDFSLGASWSLSADYALDEGNLDSIRMDGSWSGDGLRLTWTVPYDAARGEFEPIRGTLDVEGEWLDLAVEATLDRGELEVEATLDGELIVGPWAARGDLTVSNLTISGASLELEGVTESGWGGRVSWSYAGGPLSLENVRYGLFYDIGGCLRVGIDRQASDTWLYLSILAFPEAVLRYAPASSRIETGS